MREILFRGKRTDNGEWVLGLLARYNSNFETANMVNELGILIPVLSSTVGQYTGLTDKNGKKIFEGDIVVMVGDAISTITEEECKFVVRWQDEECGFNLLIMFDYEVIGNIHDNPEFLWSGS